MIERASIPSEVLTAASDALRAAQVAHDGCRRVVRDLWLPDLDFEDSQQSPRRKSEPDEVGFQSIPVRPEDVENALDALLRAILRVSFLILALWQVLPAYAGGGEAAPPLAEVMKLVNGEFDLLPGGGGAQLRPANPGGQQSAEPNP